LNYQETIDFLYHHLPYFSKQGASALNFKLDKTLKLCEFLGNPQDKLKHIHIAGTNGKGSTSHLLSAILQTHDYKVGLYTSPHLKNFSERIKINAQPVSEQEVVDFVQLMMLQIEEIKPSFFELTVAMAFWHFEKHQVDICVVEVGMGGRLDSTNIIQPLVSVITNISLDHQQYLGETLEAIAREKGGIIKKNTPIVMGEIQQETETVFREIAKEKNAFFKTKLNENNLLNTLFTDTYQDKNIETALKTVEVLEELGFQFEKEKLLYSIKKFKEIAGLKGRWQTLLFEPKVICDTGHNEAGISEVVKMIAKEKYEKLHIVFGMVAEKDVANVLCLLPKNAHYYFCKADNQRAMEAQILQEKAAKCGLEGEFYPNVATAIEQSMKNASKNDLIFIGGSNFVVAEIPFL
jgi:dihydrofolate synthase / folylpolyglutamate synthase